MDAKALTVRETLYAGNQYVIPFFQRSYSWRRRHWTRLWNDLCALIEDKKEGQHFLGPLVCTSVKRLFGDVPAYQLIDGQQRLTTLTVLLAAIRDVAMEHGLDELADEIQENYLIHKRKKDLQKYKIVPRLGDREALIGIIEYEVAEEHRRLNIVRAWEFFRETISDYVGHDAETRLDSLFTAIYGQLSLVVITIDQESGLLPGDQLAELRRFAKYELFLRRPASCENPGVRKAFEQIADLEITTAHPLLLALLDRHERGELTEADLLGCLADLSSFVFRRSICGESTRAYGRWFPEANKSLQERHRDDLRRYWLRRGWPDDRAFVTRLQEFALYRREPKKCRLVLEALERSYGHKEEVALTSLTVEHVMPQTIKSGESATDWKTMLGAQWTTAHAQTKKTHCTETTKRRGYSAGRPANDRHRCPAGR